MNNTPAASALAPFFAVLALMLGLLSLGCHSNGIRATSLPADLSPPEVVDVNSLNLSRLAASSFRSDQIGPGDLLEMQVVTGAEKGDAKTWPLVVQPDGAVEVPLVGTVSLVGQDVEAARHTITSASIERGIYRQPTVTLQVSERRTNHITVVGAVEEPGSYHLPITGSDLLSALVKAGGLSEDADTVVEIRRAPRAPEEPGPSAPDDSVFAQVAYNESTSASVDLNSAKTFAIDLVAATQQPVPSAFQLGDGDVVTVRRRPPRFVQVIGLVKKPDRIRLAPGQNPTVLDAIAMAGGVSESIADRVVVIRKVPGNPEPVRIDVSLREAKESGSGNPTLADGDVVSVEETPATFMVSAMKHLIRIGISSATF